MVNFQKVAGLHNAGGMMTGQIGKRVNDYDKFSEDDETT